MRRGGTSGGNNTLYPYYLYAANGNTGNKIYVFGVAVDGKLTQIGSYNAGNHPLDLVATPNGNYLYAVNMNSNNVSGFNIGANGKLSPIIGSPFSTGTLPMDMTIEPGGNYAYVANNGGGGSVTAFQINTNGSLDTVAGFTEPPTNLPCSIAATRVGNTLVGYRNYVFIVNSYDKTVSRFSMGTGGELTLQNSQATGNAPDAITANGPLIYLLNTQSGNEPFRNSVSGYKLNQGGIPGTYTFDAIAGLPLNVTTNPSGVAIRPDRKFLYITRKDSFTFEGDIKIFALDAAGTLGPGPVGPSAGFLPTDITIHPEGSFAYVARSAGILVYSINSSDGSLTLLQTLDFNPLGGLLALTVVKRN
jgi:DNA-binding beta-propeller fold protein YncE